LQRHLAQEISRHHHLGEIDAGNGKPDALVRSHGDEHGVVRIVVRIASRTGMQ